MRIYTHPAQPALSPGAFQDVGHMTAVDESPALCVLCPQHRAKVARLGSHVDWDCHERLQAGVRELARRYLQLSATPGRSGSIGRRSPGYGSRPPVNLHAAMLRDPRTAPTDLGDPHSPLNFAMTWSHWLRRHRRQPPPATYPSTDAEILAIEVNYLVESLDWITRQSWVPTFDQQLRAVLSQLRAATGEPNPRPVGKCAATSVDGQQCGHALFPPQPGTASITCTGCGARYDPLQQISLVRAQSGVCDHCGHLGVQHGHDDARRPCNVRWCECQAYREDGVA